VFSLPIIDARGFKLFRRWLGTVPLLFCHMWREMSTCTKNLIDARGYGCFVRILVLCRNPPYRYLPGVGVSFGGLPVSTLEATAAPSGYPCAVHPSYGRGGRCSEIFNMTSNRRLRLMSCSVGGGMLHAPLLLRAGVVHVYEKVFVSTLEAQAAPSGPLVVCHYHRQYLVMSVLLVTHYRQTGITCGVLMFRVRRS
jgi:hypothetical protein